MIKKYLNLILHFFYPIFKRFLPFQVYSYLAVGAANTMLNIGLFTIGFYIFHEKTGIDFIQSFALEWATILSLLITILSGFWLSKNFVFTNKTTHSHHHKNEFTKYCIIAIQGQLSDYLITKGLVVLLSIHPVLAYLFSTIMMLTINFFLNKYFTFHSQTKQKIS